MRGLFQFLTFVLWSITCIAQTNQNRPFDASRLSNKGQVAYKILYNADIFALGQTGLLTKQEPALLTLLRNSDAKEALMSLVADGSPEAGLYGLLGLHRVDAIVFRKTVERYQKRDEPSYRIVDGDQIRKGQVKTSIGSGCISSWEDSSKIVEGIATGKYDQIFGEQDD